MPPRPHLFLRPLVHPLPQWKCPSCLSRTLPHARPRAPPRRTPATRTQTSAFHSTRPLRAASSPTHYETLQLSSSSASAAEIKRQFYTLSKQHHPDRNRNDPDASTRFVAISEAYHVLSVPEKRAQYDATLQSAQASSWGRRDGPGAEGYPQGSYSSASFGSRPATGLNKKRSTFRGPPPSFYKSGGYGDFATKRSEYAYQSTTSNGHEDTAGQESHGGYGGFGPGQQNQGNQVPHFDDKRHKETHDNVHAHIWARRRQMRRTVRSREEEYARGDVLRNFLAVSGIVAVIGVTAKIFGDRREARDRAATAMRKEGA
ncbi:hypothetical protein J1614_004193 [Plenodomus biglobosus]|nr:hypothetical protein J1614_004193 [Plenodomus biglobosus]